ncbi:hypothetical protein JAAARDRAFT_54915 [Jaapia argillacea MUCL 33604]|uniref:Uncharacterized protein n=1 Tax=Jaapia argillacea MUCL 33604 TaxID=933084 RepID=A0A067QDJ1_9AGAM|nr:hypothetical protein JAAARDRAFT_54915 [Jaapia argillacea MUCL 33604]
METGHPLVTPNALQGTNSLCLSISPRSSSDPDRTVPFSGSQSHATPHDARGMTRVDPLHRHQRSTPYLEGPRTTTRASTVHSQPPTLPPSRIPIATSRRPSLNTRLSGSSSSSSRIANSRSPFASAFGQGANDHQSSSTSSLFPSSSSQLGSEGTSLDSRNGRYNARSHWPNQARRR